MRPCSGVTAFAMIVLTPSSLTSITTSTLDSMFSPIEMIATSTV